MKDQEIKNETAIVFRALETCNTYKECDSCLAPANANSMKADLLCRWCPELGRCSDGTDRNRQDWLKRKCDINNISSTDTCSLSKVFSYISPTRPKAAPVGVFQYLCKC